MHPARRALAGRDAGAVYDRLNEVQLRTRSGARMALASICLAPNPALRHIAERRPSSLAELADIQGMGDQKIDRFGTAFLDVLREA